jgi:hypothetical protein
LRRQAGRDEKGRQQKVKKLFHGVNVGFLSKFKPRMRLPDLDRCFADFTPSCLLRKKLVL